MLFDQNSYVTNKAVAIDCIWQKTPPKLTIKYISSPFPSKIIHERFFFQQDNIVYCYHPK